MSDPQEPVDDDDSKVEPDMDEIQEFDTESASGEIGDWAGDELEAAYMKAMLALEASEAEITVEPAISSSAIDSLENTDAPEEQLTAIKERHAATRTETTGPGSEPTVEVTSSVLAELYSQPSLSKADEATQVAVKATEVPLTPRQIIEACLFVGGDALTSKKLSGVLRGDFDSEFVDREIDELNRLYAAENRPYEIRIGDGGYRLALREEFERIRHKVYGLGPKEVRLSQEALEVLAVVAYYQPIKQARVEELGKPGCGAILRQLVRRELLAVERDSAAVREVNYKTTPRFLSLFGIRSLNELPRPEQVSYK